MTYWSNSVDIFVGRKHELKAILGSLKRGKHSLLFGEKGCGKTALIHEVMKRSSVRISSKKILFSDQSVSLKDTCLSLARCLYHQRMISRLPREFEPLDFNMPWEKIKPKFERLKTTPLKNLILNNLRNQNCIIVLDHLGKLKLKFFLFLDNLRDAAHLVLVVRSNTKKEIGKLWMLLWGFEKIELKALPLHEANQLIAYCLDGIEGVPEKVVRRIASISHGNPAVIKALCQQIHKQHDLKTSFNVELAEIDSKIGDFLEAKEDKKKCHS